MALRSVVSQPYYPPLVAAAVVLGIFTESTAALPALWRPLVVLMAVAFAIQLACSVASRSRHLGAFVSVTLFLAIVGQLVASLLLALGLFALTLWLIVSRRPLRSVRWGKATQVANVVSAITLGLAMVTAQSAIAAPPEQDHAVAELATSGGAPDIYLILLDGHPRLDTLEAEFGHDSTVFLEEMVAQGFVLSPESRSNYNLTVLTLPSLLNFETAEEMIPDPPEKPFAQYRQLARRLNASAGLEALRRVGYEVVSIPSPFSNVTLYNAGRVLDSGGISEFELDLHAKGGLRMILPDVQRTLIGNSHRSRIISTFETLESVAAEPSGPPRIVLAHVMAPHPPYVLGPMGETIEPRACFPLSCGFWAQGPEPGPELIDAVRDQVEFIDRRVAEATRSILAESRTPPVVIVFSDHGHRHEVGDAQESVRALFLAHTPGAPGLFPSDVTPLQVMPRIFNQYFGTDLPVRAGDFFYTDQRRLWQTGPYDMTPISGFETGALGD